MCFGQILTQDSSALDLQKLDSACVCKNIDSSQGSNLTNFMKLMETTSVAIYFLNNKFIAQNRRLMPILFLKAGSNWGVLMILTRLLEQ
jgi:hypothetical protein